MGNIKVKRLSSGTLLKLIFIGLASFFLAFIVVVLMNTLFGDYRLSSPDGDPLSKSGTVFGTLFMALSGIIIVPLFSFLFWLFAWPGFWLWSKVFNMKIRYIDVD